MSETSSLESQQTGAFLLRIAFAVILLAHASLKLFVFTIPGTVGFFESVGFPAVTAYLVIFGELFGGIAMLLGIYTRLVAVLSIPIMLGAAWVHGGNGWVFSNQGGGWEFPVLLAVLAVVIVFLGSGRFALKGLPVLDDYVPAVLRA